MLAPTPLEDILLTPGTVIMVELPTNQASQIGDTVTLRQANKKKVIALDVLGRAPGPRPTRRMVVLRVPE